MTECLHEGKVLAREESMHVLKLSPARTIIAPAANWPKVNLRPPLRHAMIKTCPICADLGVKQGEVISRSLARTFLSQQG